MFNIATIVELWHVLKLKDSVTIQADVQMTVREEVHAKLILVTVGMDLEEMIVHK